MPWSFYRGKKAQIQKNRMLENRKVWQFLNCQQYPNRTIFDGFVAILAKK